MPINYHTYSTAKEATDNATSKLNEVLGKTIESKTPTLLLVSGGSSIALLDRVNEAVLGSHITISVLDERYSDNPKENNFAQIAITPFYSRAIGKGARFIDTHVNGRTQMQLAADFNRDLGKWFDTNPTGTVVATIGVGPDGHTSGMMPFPEDPARFEQLFEPSDPNNFVTAYDATGKNQYTARVTTNMNLMRKIDTAIVFITGEKKRGTIERLRVATGTLAETPARIINELRNAYLFTDIRP